MIWNFQRGFSSAARCSFVGRRTRSKHIHNRGLLYLYHIIASLYEHKYVHRTNHLCITWVPPLIYKRLVLSDVNAFTASPGCECVRWTYSSIVIKSYNVDPLPSSRPLSLLSFFEDNRSLSPNVIVDSETIAGAAEGNAVLPNCPALSLSPSPPQLYPLHTITHHKKHKQEGTEEVIAKHCFFLILGK